MGGFTQSVYINIAIYIGLQKFYYSLQQQKAKSVKRCLTITELVVYRTFVALVLVRLNQRKLWLNMFRQQLTVFALAIVCKKKAI